MVRLSWTKFVPRINIWVTRANQTRQQSFCLSLASVNEPFKTCFFRVPIGNAHELITVTQGYTNNCTNLANANVSEAACCIINGLNITLPGDPQELDLLGSVAVGNGSENWTQTCFMVGAYEQGIDVYRSHNLIGWIKVSTSTPGFGCEDFEGRCCFNLSDHSEFDKKKKGLIEKTKNMQIQYRWMLTPLTPG